MININTIRELYDKNTPALQTGQLVCKALELFESSRSSAIVITDDKKHPQGILTERDITKHAGHWDEILSLPVSEIMSSPVTTIGQEHDFRDAYMQMTEHGFQHMVVVKKDGSLAGMLDEGHFLRHLTPEQLLAVKEVKLVMTKNVSTVESTQSVAETIHLMSESQISSVIIVRDKKPIGIFTERDSIHLAREGDALLKAPITKYMASPLKTIRAKSSVIDAEHMLTHEHIRHLVVVNDKEELSGIISQHDLVKGISGIYVEMLRDTIRKQSDILCDNFNRLEEQSVLNNILNSFPEKLIIACDLKSFIKFTNNVVFDKQHTLPSKGEKLDNSLQCFDSNLSDSIINGEVTSILNAEPTIYDSKGNKHYFKTSYAPIFSKKKLLQGFLFTAEDVTAEKQSLIELRETKKLLEKQNSLLQEKEHQLLQAQKLGKMGSWKLNIVKNQLDWSDEIFNIFEIDKSKFGASYEAFLDAIHPEDRDAVNQAYTQSLQNRLPYTITHRLLMQDGRVKWVEEKCTTTFDKDANPLESIGTVQDITDKKEQERKVIQQEEMMIIQSRQAAMGEMVSMIAHQWRQPLSVVSMIVNNLMLDIEIDMFDVVVAKKDFVEINNQIQYMSATIDDFRNFFKPSKELENDSVLHILQDITKIIDPSLGSNSIQMEIECDSTLMIQTYKSELKQVIINILSNAKDALKNTQIDHRIIKISVKFENEHILFSIFNNGPKIDSEPIQKIFEPYFTTKEILGGTGIGLYMSKSIIEKHMHGNIEVKNINQGVEFTITIPKVLEKAIDD